MARRRIDLRECNTPGVALHVGSQSGKYKQNNNAPHARHKPMCTMATPEGHAKTVRVGWLSTPFSS